MTPNQNSQATDPHIRSREASGQAVVAADEAYLRDAIQSVKWEERGFLRRLVRVDRSSGD